MTVICHISCEIEYVVASMRKTTPVDEFFLEIYSQISLHV